jgi:glycosyltransferase involved in cell wall biosynthesis
MPAERKLLIQGWRFYAASYAIANAFLCLELLRRPHIRLWHQDMPYSRPDVPHTTGLLPSADEQRLATIPAPAPGDRPDAVLRIACPLDFHPVDGIPTFVFATAEFGCVPHVNLARRHSLREDLAGSPARILTPSQWSRMGLIRSGADPAIISVIPLGVDPALFRPLPESERQALRRQYGWNAFTFLHIGHMSPNKGIQVLLRAFAQVAARHPDVRLMLKGLDDLYDSRTRLARAANLTPEEITLVSDRMHYFGQCASFAQLAELYQMADAYVSPYSAEGFNMPVLEAIACGLPVICTAGGPTDDFTSPQCARRIRAARIEMIFDGEPGISLLADLPDLVSHMLAVKQNPALAAQARIAGPALVSQQYTWKHVVDRLLDAIFPP